MVINNKNSTIVVVLKIISNLPSNNVMKNNTKKDRRKLAVASSEKSIGKRIACYLFVLFRGFDERKVWQTISLFVPSLSSRAIFS